MLESVLASWRLSAPLHEPEEPATAQALEEAQAALGRQLPDAAVALFRAYRGGSFLGGNLAIYPPLADGPEDLSLATASDLLRSWDWPIPEELVVFGDNGAGDQFGRPGRGPGPIRARAHAAGGRRSRGSRHMSQSFGPRGKRISSVTRNPWRP